MLTVIPHLYKGKFPFEHICITYHISIYLRVIKATFAIDSSLFYTLLLLEK
jgi:hypothetical protein